MPKLNSLGDNPEVKRTYKTVDRAGNPVTLCTLENVTAVGTNRADGSHYLETADGKKHIVTTINGSPFHIEFVADEWVF